MNLAKVSTFLAASFLLLTLLGDTTEACKCYFPHPQTAFCSYDIVLRVKFLRGYGIKTTRVYKGPEEMQNLRDFDTPPRGGACGYSHEGSFREEYLVTGSLEGDRVTITICDLIIPWARLTLAQRRGFTSEYSKGCSCSIVECHSECSITSNQCVRADSRMPPNLRDFQNKHMACLPQVEKNGTCTWKSLDTQES
ncbi:metalloproteinase inhibitor 1 isoform X1 [Anolis carolinensis]|nr:PREDICTED: metalloproteinase inhibitor 1 isoform X2 [Anolis carolinensis]XP_008101752.1 PREDICTED: metalloproteinase inhibitor 1 isoform X2 [Anolis carolinensis]|eukprot:XP_008101751.1 PREDICTED: metalloproteinase inhibitor 1 isoform X2 [Anolis carolinensis]